jgi:hypothetical protein
MHFLKKIKITPLIMFLILIIVLVISIIFGSTVKEGFEETAEEETTETPVEEQPECETDKKQAHCDGGKIYIHADSEMISESKKSEDECFEACKSNPECDMYLMKDEGTCYNYKNVSNVSMYCSPGDEPKPHNMWGDIKKRIYDKIINFPLIKKEEKSEKSINENEDYILKTQIVPPVCPTCPTCPDMPEKVSCTNCGGNGGSGTKDAEGKSLVLDEKEYKRTNNSNPLSETVKATGNLADKTLSTGDALLRDTASGATGIAKDTVTGATGIATDTVTGATGLLKDTASGATGLLRDFGSGVKDVLTTNKTQVNNRQPQKIGVQTTGVQNQPRQRADNGTIPMVLGTNNQYSAAQPMRTQVTAPSSYIPITADFSAFGR